MKMEDIAAAGGLCLVCGCVSFTWESFICMGVGMLQNGAGPISSELIPLYFDLWSAPLLVGAALPVLFPMARYFQIGTVAGFCTPALITLFPLLQIFYG